MTLRTRLLSTLSKELGDDYSPARSERIVEGFLREMREPDEEAVIASMSGQAKHFDDLEASGRLSRANRLVLTVYAGNGECVKAGHSAMIDAALTTTKEDAG